MERKLANTMAMMKRTSPLLLISIMAIVVAHEAPGEEVPLCAKDCMPVCLKVEGATIHACEESCHEYCKQISGRGSNGGVSIWVVPT
ncbi:hypothetical protein AAG906_034513 [Vitis piasezkii]